MLGDKKGQAFYIDGREYIFSVFWYLVIGSSTDQRNVDRFYRRQVPLVVELEHISFLFAFSVAHREEKVTGVRFSFTAIIAPI